MYKLGNEMIFVTGCVYLPSCNFATFADISLMTWNLNLSASDIFLHSEAMKGLLSDPFSPISTCFASLNL